MRGGLRGINVERQLCCGPWVGELGWELMSWQGLLRRASKDFGCVIVCGPEGHEALYEDFCHKYFPHRITGVKDCWWVEGAHPSVVAATSEFLLSMGGQRLLPERYVSLGQQHFVIYGHVGPEIPRFDVLVHARKRIGKRPDHAWSEPKWDILVENLVAANLLVAAIGTVNESYCPRGAVDRRDIPLRDLMNLMAAAGLVVGPSSGPMHLASLCRTPHIVWTDKQRYSSINATNRERYEKLWNPFQCRCAVLDAQGWDPAYLDVLKAVLSELDRGVKP